MSERLLQQNGQARSGERSVTRSLMFIQFNRLLRQLVHCLSTIRVTHMQHNAPRMGLQQSSTVARATRSGFRYRAFSLSFSLGSPVTARFFLASFLAPIRALATSRGSGTGTLGPGESSLNRIVGTVSALEAIDTSCLLVGWPRTRRSRTRLCHDRRLHSHSRVTGIAQAELLSRSW